MTVVAAAETLVETLVVVVAAACRDAFDSVANDFVAPIEAA